MIVDLTLSLADTPVTRRLRMGEHLLQSLPVQAFLGHHGTLALSIYEHFAAYSGPLFHFHIHASFLMRVPVLVRPLLRTGFQPAFTIPVLWKK